MADPIGALRVDLEANVAKFNKDMGKAKASVAKNTSAMNKSFKSTTTAVKGLTISLKTMMKATIFTAGIAAIYKTVTALKALVDEGDRLGKLSKQLGASAENLDKLRQVSELAGSDLETAARAMGNLNAAVEAAGRTSTSRQAEAFEKLNINLKEFRELKPVDQLEAFAKAVVKVGDESTGLEAAMAALGVKAGRELMPTLQALAKDGLGEVSATMTGDFAKAAEQAKDNMAKIGEAINKQLLPWLLKAMEGIGIATDYLIKFFNVGTENKLKDEIVEITKEIIKLKKELAKPASNKTLVGGGFMGTGRKSGEAVANMDRQTDLKILKAALDNKKAELADFIKGETAKSDALSGAIKKWLKEPKDTGKGKKTPDAAAAKAAAEKAAIEKAKELDARMLVAAPIGEFLDAGRMDEIESAVAGAENMAAKTAAIAEAVAAETATIAAETAAAAEAMAEATAETERFNDAMEDVGRATINTLDGITGIIDGLKSGTLEWHDVLRRVIPLLGNLIKAMSSLDSSGGSAWGAVGGFLGGMFGFAEGGQVGRTGPALVHKGERVLTQPQNAALMSALTPSKSMLGSAAAMAGSGGSSSEMVVINNNFSVGVSETVRQQLMGMMPFIEQRTEASVMAAINAGGSMSKAVGRRS